MADISRRDTVTRLKVQLDDTVASVESRNSIVIYAFHREESLGKGVVAVVDIEPQRFAFAYRVVDLREVFLVVVNIQIIDAVEPVEQGRQCVDHMECTVFLRQRVNTLIAVRPCVQCVFVCELAYRECVAEVIR